MICGLEWKQWARGFEESVGSVGIRGLLWARMFGTNTFPLNHEQLWALLNQELMRAQFDSE